MGAMDSLLTPDQIAAYRDTGYAVARGVVSPAELAELRAAADQIVAMAKDFADDTFVGVTFFNIFRKADPFAKNIAEAERVPGLIRRVTYPYAVSETLNRYRAHPRLLGVVASLLGPDVKQIVNQLNFNPPHAGTGWGWHQDYRFRKAGIGDLVQDFVQTILAIDLCSTVTGGIRLIPRSHLLGDLKLDVDNENAESYFDAKLAVTPELAPGDVVLFNSHVIHGSTPNKSPHQRRVYINGYARGTSKIGMPVLTGGVPTSRVVGKMEYEGDVETLPKASKY
jgi:ectoine hydroxylase-related dioxygenase (phytanoyl-CoA dioxygenase family)